MLSIGEKYLDYTITGYIGRGGMGTVMLLEKPDGERAALKILHPHLMDDDELVKRFYLEAEVAGRIKCPRVCKVYDIRKVSLGSRDSHAILMEYIEGEGLDSMMENREAFGEEWALHVADGVLEALEEAGITGKVGKEPIGSYTYEKMGGRYKVKLFHMEVTKLQDTWEENYFRKRKLVSPKQAIKKVVPAAVSKIMARHFHENRHLIKKKKKRKSAKKKG